jgi:hypothetical protein
MSILIACRHSNKWRHDIKIILSFHFRLKDRPGRISFSYADPLAFLFSVDKSIGSGCFFPDLDPSVNLIGHANDRQTFLLLGAVKNKISVGPGYLLDP